MPRHEWDTRVNAFEEAAARVLRRARGPLTVREITERAISTGLITPSGRTPDKSMYSIIRRANERRRKRGLKPRFIKKVDGKRVAYVLVT